MTLEEFDALKIGDKVRNERLQLAEIIDSGPYGHKIVWDGTAVPYTLYRAGRLWVSFEAVRRDTETAQEFPSPTAEQ